MDENGINVNEGQVVDTPTPGTDDGVKTYTQEEVDAMLQRESDRRVTEALRKQQMKNDAKVKEAEKLAQMNEQQKFEYQLEQREKAIAEKERELTLAENKNAASNILAEKGLSLSLVEFVVAEDADTMDSNIQRLEKAFKASVKAEVEKRLGSKTPTKNLGTDEMITKEAFSKMSLQEQSQLFETNPEIYKALVK